MDTPTDKQIEQAKAYVRARVDAELSIKAHVSKLLDIASSRIAEIAKRYGMSVNMAVRSTYYPVKEGIGKVMEWLYSMIDEFTSTLAVAEHIEHKDAIIDFINKEQYGSTFSDRLRGYITNFKDNINERHKAESSLRLLTSVAVSQGWMHHLLLKAQKDGMEGFFSFRGSSYPCSYCDSMVGFHPIEKYVGAWHPHCKCFFVFV